jgi:peptide deformylase
MKLDIVQAGEAVLRRKARQLSREEILGRYIQDLIDSMRETMRGAPGVGVAAPQIGLPLQLAVIEDRPEYIEKIPPEQASERQRSAIPFHVLINPKLIVEGDEAVEFFEGCLSLAGFTAIVPRAMRVRVECLNEQAEPVVIAAAGWYARILQHEIDHLNGILYIDRMKSRSFSTLDNYTRYWKDKPAGEIWRQVPERSPDV